jgi:formylglycine-generating enzyme required for sulfatase activity
MRFVAVLLALTACDADPKAVLPVDDTAPSDDSGAAAGDDTGGGPIPPIDQDGDGFPRWDTSDDPATADCDDLDPSITPDVEVFVPGGSFVRGATGPAEADVQPARDIALSPYCIDVREVTNDDFVQLLTDRANAGAPNQDDQGRPLFDFEDDDDDVPERIIDEGGAYRVADGYGDHPVVEVYHWGAEAYCASRAGSLPTEAQWEKAARGTTPQTYPWGEAAPDCTLGNLRPGVEGPQGPPPCVDDTVAVGSYASGASPYGALDMAGNVAEWVHDWYRDDYYATSPDTDPTGPDSGWSDMLPGGGGEARITRGGSYGQGDYSLRVFHRYVEPADGTSNGVGFRCVREL